jgi:hypothetical protein
MNLRTGLSRTTGHQNSAVHLVVFIVCALWWAPLAQAQFRASLRGTVTDPQGAAVSGATVTLTYSTI